MKLKDKVAIITGSGSGIGKATAFLFAKEGAKVVVNDEHGDEVEEVVNKIKREKGEVFGIQADVTNWTEVEKMVNQVLEKFGKIDILVNNVGIFQTFNFLQSNEENWDKLLDSNLKSTLICTRIVLPIMLKKIEEGKQEKGKIVNIGSVSGMIAIPGAGDIYGASKAGVIQFTKALAADYIDKKIWINCVSPGATDTPLLAPLLQDPLACEALLATIPQGRVGKPEELAYAILFLASDESDRIVGVNLPVTGGHELR